MDESTGPVNLLSIDRPTVAENHCVAYIGQRTVTLPPNKLAARVRVIHPISPRRRDALARGRFRPQRNHLRGRICRILPLDNAVFVAVDMGQILWAEITHRRWPNSNSPSVAT